MREKSKKGEDSLESSHLMPSKTRYQSGDELCYGEPRKHQALN